MIPILRNAMLAIRYTFNRNERDSNWSLRKTFSRIIRGLILDDLDALVLTFGGPLAPHANAGGEGPARAHSCFRIRSFLSRE